MQYEKEKKVKKVKKIVSWGVSICILIGCMIPCAMAASNDYTTWRQSDSAWNQSVAWPASQYPAATMRDMREAGCLGTSIVAPPLQCCDGFQCEQF